MSDRARVRQRRHERAVRRTGRWEAEFAAARSRTDRLTVAYRWCLSEMHRDGRLGVWYHSERYEPAIEALIKAARGDYLL